MWIPVERKKKQRVDRLNHFALDAAQAKLLQDFFVFY